MNAAGCTGKVSFGTFAQAERSARNVRRRHGGNVVPYRCECGDYHLGSTLTGSHAVARDRRLKIQKLREREVWE